MLENEDSLPRLLAERYRLEAKLGSGGMGIVYRATDLTMHRAVAVKLILGVDGAALDDDVAGRFLREAKNTARVQHENIIEVYDLGRSDQGDLFFVMELLEGESLSTKLRRDGKLSIETSVHIARQMCAALHVAHAAEIIHRDLKPANVMLIRRAGQDEYVKVLDFGVAKSYAADQDTQLTHTGMLVGTVEYMAPEQIMGRKVDGRTDIYALGVLLYRMLAGKGPFRDGGVPAQIHAHLNVFPKPMTESGVDIPGALDRVVLRCLAKQPEQRYESMEELSRALKDALAPTTAGLPSLEYDTDDAYDSAKTEIARPMRESPREPPPAPADESFDDATVKFDRPDELPLPGRVPTGASAAAPSPESDPYERTKIMARNESTAERVVPEEVARQERAGPRECAMCRTVNPPYSRACKACGVSLAREDQDEVRARVTVPRTAHLAAPHVPPPLAGGYGAPLPFHHSPGQGLPGVQNMPSMHGAQPVQGGSAVHGIGWGQMPPAAPPPPPSMWQRFLSWTGLRGR